MDMLCNVPPDMQLMDSLGLGGGQMPGAGPGTQEARSILSSIAAYLRMLEDTAESPPMVLPSLSYQPAQGLLHVPHKAQAYLQSVARATTHCCSRHWTMWRECLCGSNYAVHLC